MLRRPATALQITSEDVAAYEDRRAREALAAAQQARAATASEGGMEGVQSSPDPELRVRRARDERIGVSWLYFGVLDVFFSRHVDAQTFRTQTDSSNVLHSQQAVSSLPLIPLLDRWIEEVIIPVLDPPHTRDVTEDDFLALFKYRKTTIEILENILAQVEMIEQLPQSSQAPLPVILLSAKVLIGTLSGVSNEVITLGEDLLTLGYFDRSGHIEQSFPLPPGPGHQKRASPTCQLLLDEFAAQDFCPFVARQICQTYNFVAAYYATRLGNNSKASHRLCSTSECVANNVDMTNYTTRHASADCKCPHLPIPVEEMRSIIEAGGIPLVRVESGENGHVVVKVKRMTNDTPYIAFSHVWSDGLGNPAANSLPSCAMMRLQDYVEKMHQPRMNLRMGVINIGVVQWDLMRMTHDFKPRWFWLDTLCIPVGDPYMDLKMKAINQMAAIYASALQVLVLDSGMEAFHLDEPGVQPCEILAMVCTSAWMRRCWTFQEAGISQQCQIQCLERAVDPLEITIGQLSKLQWLFQTDSFVEMIKRSFYMVCWALSNLRRRYVYIYMRTMPNRDSRNAIMAVVSRPFKDVLMDHFQGRRSATTTYDAKGTETLYREFVRCWNTLTKRTTTMWDDVHIILASLLDFNSFEILKLKDPAERMKCLLWSMPALPLDLFFNADGPRHDPGGHHVNRWLPLYPRHNQVKAEPRVQLGSSWLTLNGITEVDEKEDSSEQSSSEGLPQEKHRICAIRIDDRMADGPGSKRCKLLHGDSVEPSYFDITLLRQAADTFANSLCDGNAILVLEQDLTKMDENVTRGALFQVLDHAPGYSPWPESPVFVGTRLEAIFDCPVTVEVVQSTKPASGGGRIEQATYDVEAKIVEHPWKLDIRCDPPSVSYPLPRRSLRPDPSMLFGIFYFVYIGLWYFDFVSTFILVAICRKQLASFLTFTKTVVIIRFMFDGLTLSCISRLQFLNVALFLLWEVFPLALPILYLASRLADQRDLSKLEYAFVTMAIASNVFQLFWKWAWKWSFLPMIMDSWQRTFEPEWTPKGMRNWLLKLFDPPNEDAERQNMIGFENKGI
ncbi:hypothetical protein G7046_g2800 [Stylonectria norvegica]|nr:hypothetical protein G7046_g2800 [Stylonectria norvegica]